MLQHGDISSLPLRYRNGKLSSGKKIKEFHCLAIILSTFIFAWISLTMCMPAMQQTDASFKVSYSRFAPRSVLSDLEVPDSTGDSSQLHGVGINVGEHISVKRDIESSKEQQYDLDIAPSKHSTLESVVTPENVHKEEVVDIAPSKLSTLESVFTPENVHKEEVVVTDQSINDISESVVHESNSSITENRKEKVKEVGGGVILGRVISETTRRSLL